ncbi:MAG: hypothetical protein ACI97A_001637 [Planctomycetota bacterium]|jgi:hypothetical protein
MEILPESDFGSLAAIGSQLEKGGAPFLISFELRLFVAKASSLRPFRSKC